MTIDRWNSFLVVRVVPANGSRTADQPPLWGSYRVAGDIIRFEPRFPLEPGMSYEAEFDPVRLHEVARALTPSGAIAVGQPRSHDQADRRLFTPQKARAIHDAGRRNLPVARPLAGKSAPILHLLFRSDEPGRSVSPHHIARRATGKIVDAPFLELDEELWSPDGTRFTLLFDPVESNAGSSRARKSGRFWKQVSHIPWSSIAIGSMRRETRSRPGFERPSESVRPTKLRRTRRPGPFTRPRPARAIPWSVRFPEPLTGPFSIA